MVLFRDMQSQTYRFSPLSEEVLLVQEEIKSFFFVVRTVKNLSTMQSWSFFSLWKIVSFNSTVIET